MKKNSKSQLILLFLIIILTLYLINSELIVSSILDYTHLFITKLFPTSFLIYIISTLLINYGLIELLSKTSKKPAIIYIIFMSMITGFPSGPKYIKDLYTKKYIDEQTSNYLLTFTHFPNPIFILGSVSNIIPKTYSLYIFLSIILSNFLISIFFSQNISSSRYPNIEQESFSKVLATAIPSALNLLIIVYGTSLFFYLISLIITTYLDLSPILFVITNGIFDLTKGIFSTTIISSNIFKSLLIIIFIAFGSLSIHIQIKSILSDTNLNYKNFLYGRIFSTILSLLIFLLILKF